MAKQKTKSNKVTPILTLIPYPGKCTMSYYTNIISTNWRGAAKCALPEKADSWGDVVWSTTFYFPPVVPRFKFCGTSEWADELVYTGRFDGPHLVLNVTYVRDTAPMTLNMVFRNGLMRLDHPEDFLQEKTSTFYQQVLCAARRAQVNSKEERAQIRDIYEAQNLSVSWIEVLCGGAGSFTTARVRRLCVSTVFRDLLDLFKTLSTIDYAEQMGLSHYVIGFPEYAVFKNELYAVEAECSRVKNPYSDIKLQGGGSPNYFGDVSNFFDFGSRCLGRMGAAQLAYQANPDEDINLDEVDANARRCYFYIAPDGSPIMGVDYADATAARWMLRATGIPSKKSNGAEICALYERVEGSWVFRVFSPIADIVRVIREHVPEMSTTFWADKMVPSYRHITAGFPVERPDSSEVDALSFVPSYTCSKEFLELQPPTSNVATLEDANTFLDTFIRMLRRRRVENDWDTMYNTGVLSTTGYYIWVMVPNLHGPRRDIQPSIVPGVTHMDDLLLPFQDRRFLLLLPDFDLDLRSFTHGLEERGYRLPKEAQDFPVAQLTSFVKNSVDYAKHMLAVNPMFAQPMWSESDDKIYHFIPLYESGNYTKDGLLGALLVKRGRVATLYSLDMARRFARFFQCPVAAWLA